MVLTFFILAGCNSVTIKYHSAGQPPPFCPTEAKEKIAVYWGTAWRTDQKETTIREKYADEVINKFFAADDCFETVLVGRDINGKDALLANDAELISAAREAGADRVFLLRIEELGPNLYVYLSPILWQTKNEVVLQIRKLNINTQEVESDLSTQWLRGGPFTLNGASSLPADLSALLKEIFYGKQEG